MQNAIIVHGACSKQEFDDPKSPTLSNSHWLPWLSKQLQLQGIHPICPEMPTPYHPNYSQWCQEFERYPISPQTVLVGHSCGGGFLVRWLSEHPTVHVGKVVLVAPWLDPDNSGGIKESFFSFTIDPNIAERVQGITVFSSTNDSDYIQASIAIIEQKISSIKLVECTNYGHFCNIDLGTEAFPELLTELTV